MVRVERERDRPRRRWELDLVLRRLGTSSLCMRKQDNSSIALRAMVASYWLRLMYTWRHPAATAASAIILGVVVVLSLPRRCG